MAATSEMYPNVYGQQQAVAGKHRPKPKKRPSTRRQGTSIPRAVSAANSSIGGTPANRPIPTTTTPLGQTAAAPAPSPGLSSYEKRRKGILDIMNDPALQEYNSSYMPNYDIARSQVENAFAQAMGEVQSRQAMGEGLLAQMPGQIDQTFNDAGAGIDQATAATAAAQAKSGVASYMVPGADVAPVRAALSMEQAGQKAQMPALGVGLANLTSEQRQQLTTDRGSALADIAQREEEARASASQQDSGPSWLQQQLIQQELADEEAKANKQKNSTQWGAEYIGQDRGGDIAKSYPKLANRVRTGSGDGASQAAYDFVTKGLRGQQAAEGAGEDHEGCPCQVAAPDERDLPGHVRHHGLMPNPVD